jgi:hypothetical protein
MRLRFQFYLYVPQFLVSLLHVPKKAGIGIVVQLSAPATSLIYWILTFLKWRKVGVRN